MVFSLQDSQIDYIQFSLHHSFQHTLNWSPGRNVLFTRLADRLTVRRFGTAESWDCSLHALCIFKQAFSGQYMGRVREEIISFRTTCLLFSKWFCRLFNWPVIYNIRDFKKIIPSQIKEEAAHLIVTGDILGRLTENQHSQKLLVRNSVILSSARELSWEPERCNIYYSFSVKLGDIAFSCLDAERTMASLLNQLRFCQAWS